MLRIIFCGNNFTRLIGVNKIIYNYKWAKKVIDIRADPQKIKKSSNNQRSNYKKEQNSSKNQGSWKLSQKQHDRKHFETIMPSKISNQSYNLSSQGHLINKSLKNVETLYQLFKLHNKYKNRLNVNQYLNFFQKMAYLQHFGQKNNKEQMKNIGVTENALTQNYASVLDGLKKLIFSTSHAPEVYVEFIHILSKCHNQFMYNKGFQEICIKIIKNQLLVVSKQNTKFKSKAKSDQISKQDVDKNTQQQRQKEQKQQNYVSTSQVISIFNNYKLAQSLLRILNHRTAQYKNENSKLMISLLRQVVTYLHTPSTPNQINNRCLFQLVSQYIIIYPHLKLPNGVLKSLIRQCLIRVKYEDVLKKIKNQKKVSKQNQQRLEQITIVNSLKKLLLLQRLLIQQTKTSALRKQIMETKINNIQFSSFYKIEQKIHKYIVELLPKCKIYSQPTQSINQQDQNQGQDVQSHGPLWQHIHLIPMLKDHVKLMMIETPIDILSKSELLTTNYDEFEAIITYLLNIFNYAVQLNKSNKLQVYKRKKFFNILTNSYDLFYILMKKELQLRIPAPIVHKCINGTLLTSLIGDFNYLTKQLKIFVIWCLLNQKSNNLNKNSEKSGKNSQLKVNKELIQELISSLLNPDKDSVSQFKTASKIATGSWYIRLLGANPQYLQFLKAQLWHKDQQITHYSVQGVIKDIQQYINQEYDFRQYKEDQGKRNEDIYQILKELGQKMGKHLRSIKNSQGVNKILKYYQKVSGQNSLYSERQFKQIEKIKGKYQTKISGWGTRIKQQQIRRKNKQRKISLSYIRVEVMLHLIQQYFGSSQQQIQLKNQAEKVIMAIYQRQIQFLLGKYEKKMTQQQRKLKINQLFFMISKNN